VHVISAGAYTLDGVRRLEDQGVTDLIVGFRWPYVTGPDPEPLDTKLTHLRRYADTIITNARHYHALQEVLQSLIDIRNGFENKIPADLVALDIRRCLHYLGEITGEITNEDQLDYIFSKFCIGK
jgi:hypothetical protein